jgi:uncharacterized protein (DUF1800 family)
MDIARHPATAHHIATKLAAHFVSDTPPASLVDRLARRFLDTDGDLKEVTRALLVSNESWQTTRGKIKQPTEWVMGVLRAGGVKTPNVGLVMQACSVLGQPIWTPPSPKGFSDDSSAWLNGTSERLDVANRFGERFEPTLKPVSLVERVLGPLASKDTRDVVTRAGDQTQAFTLLVMTPEFMRR